MAGNFNLVLDWLLGWDDNSDGFSRHQAFILAWVVPITTAAVSAGTRCSA